MTMFPYGEISLQRNFFTSKYPTAKFPTAKIHTAKFQVTGRLKFRLLKCNSSWLKKVGTRKQSYFLTMLDHRDEAGYLFSALH